MTEATKETGNLIFIFTYILGWISGILVYITEGQRNDRMKFHSLQAIFLGLIATVVDMIFFFIPYLGPLLAFLIWLYGMYIAYRAYNGVDVRAPVIGDYALRYSDYSI
jgi:uncharacterized membrane protein